MLSAWSFSEDKKAAPRCRRLFKKGVKILKHTPWKIGLLMGLVSLGCGLSSGAWAEDTQIPTPRISSVKAPEASSDEALSRLKTWLAMYPEAKGTFTQRVMDRTGREIQPRSEGSFRFMRPGKFEWAYTSPDVQRLISNGAVLWIYEPDLEQVIEKSVEGQLSGSPAAILFGDPHWDRYWRVTEPEAGLIVASPKNKDLPYDTVKIRFNAKNVPTSLTLEDAFGQTTVVEFPTFEKVHFQPTDFEFTIPKGVEVLRDAH